MQHDGHDRTPDEWGIECSLYTGELDWRVPHGFGVSASDEQVVDYFRLIAAELERLPHRYGYDPLGKYTVLVQTWDRARLPVRSLAFGRQLDIHSAVGLIPDAYFIAAAGYIDLHHLALRLPAWSERAETLVWRGAVTGQPPFQSMESIPRIKLALLGRDMSDADIAITKVHETLDLPHQEVERFLARERLAGDVWPVQTFSQYKFTIDIDGHANAWGLLEKLILGCCVLKVQSPFEQWYYSRLHAWEHYVPVAADLSDLRERIEWCRNNDAQCRWIAENGSRLAATLRLHAELPRSCLEFMKAATATFMPEASPGPNPTGGS